MQQGDLFSMSFCNDIPWVIASGGNKGEIAVWDCSENFDIENHFKPQLAEGSYDKNDYNPDAVIVEDDNDNEFEDVEEVKTSNKQDKKSKKAGKKIKQRK